jgi:hypothetical protein
MKCWKVFVWGDLKQEARVFYIEAATSGGALTQVVNALHEEGRFHEVTRLHALPVPPGETFTLTLR